MKVFHGIQALTQSIQKPIITIGNFDGVHLGHRRIIELAISKARAINGTVVVYTFRPHPQFALRPEANLQLLSTYDEKLELLLKLGVDVIIEEPFSREFSTTGAEQFFRNVLLHKLSAEAIIVGYDFGFGKERQGGLAFLEAFCESAGVELTVVPPMRIEHEIVSSSCIREHLLAGDIATANSLLGAPFFYRGVVRKGEGRGHKIGYPTANTQIENKLTLPFGVYATSTVATGACYPSITNIGVRPTFISSQPELPALVETHLLQTDIDLYGTELEIQFLHRIREERKFAGIDELKAQIAKDISESKVYYSRFFKT